MECHVTDKPITARLSGTAVIQNNPKFFATTTSRLAVLKLKKEDPNIVYHHRSVRYIHHQGTRERPTARAVVGRKQIVRLAMIFIV